MDYTIIIIIVIVAIVASALLMYNNKPVYALSVILSTAVPIILTVLLTKSESYTKQTTFTNSFPSGTNLMLMDNTGDISFKPVSDIDKAINSTVDSLNTDMTNNFITFRSASNSLYAPVGDYAFKTSVPPAYQQAGNYVQYSDNIGIQAPNYPGYETNYIGRAFNGAGWYPETDSRYKLNSYATLKIVKPPTLPPN